MSQPMKGLVRFIADLRNARARDLETKRINQELANIRLKFKDANLSGYQKKKYICKLVYIYILGYDVNFGHLESISLISSNTFSEKQIGYLAVSVLLNEKSEMLHLVINSIQKDLNDLNDYFTCLALNCVATVGGTTMCDALANDVFKLLISPTSQDFVRKKAALTVLRLYRKDPKIIPPSKADRIVALLDDTSFGVATSAASLVIALVQDDPESYKLSYSKVVRRLQQLVFEHACPEEYLYYNVPVPWFFVKLFKLLQYYPPSTDETIQIAIAKVIHKVIDLNATPSKNVQQNNAQNAVLFEVINLAIHLDIDPKLMERIVNILGQFLTARETNIRYLALNAMANLAARYEHIPIGKYLITVIQSLRDRDISVRRKAIDLLYSICNADNVKVIVTELLKYLQAADFAIRSEMVIRIAILVEKYANEYQWYVDISLNLISIAGSHVSDEVWQRVVQIVVNNESLQAYSVRTVVKYLKEASCNENMVKIGGYLLGEYGHLVAEEPGNSPIEQFLALHDRFPSCSPFTKGLLLTTYIKFLNLFAEIRPQLLQVFEFHLTSIDTELQQRAFEYLNMAKPENAGILPSIWDEMPPFPERTSALLTRLHSKHIRSEDKRVWMLGNHSSQQDKTAIIAPTAAETSTLTSTFADKPPPPPPMPRKGNIAANTLVTQPTGAVTSTKDNNQTLLTSGWERNFKKLLTTTEGIFYEDSLIQIGLRSEYRKHLGCLILYFRNISGSLLQSLSVELINPAGEDVLGVSTKNFPESTIKDEKTTQQVIIVNAKQPFSESPLIKITYMAGTLKVLTLKLPVILEKYMDPAVLTSEDYFKKWALIGNEGELETQKIFKNISYSSTDTQRPTDDRRNFTALNYSNVKNADPNPNNLVGASILHTSEGGSFGCLVRLEPDPNHVNYRVTVRATDNRIPAILSKNISLLYQL